MNWKEITISEDGTHFLYQNENIFNRVFLSLMKFHEPGLAPVKDEEGWFHIRQDGTALYETRYQKAFGYYDNRASVVDFEGKSFHLNENGERISGQNYQWAGNFQEHRCPVRAMNGKYHHILPDGSRAYQEEYSYAGDFREGIACVMTSHQLATHILPNGTLLHNRFFQDIGVYHKGVATARDAAGWFHINKQGGALYTGRFQIAEPYYNGTALVTCFDGNKILIDEGGNQVVSL